MISIIFALFLMAIVYSFWARKSPATSRPVPLAEIQLYTREIAPLAPGRNGEQTQSAPSLLP